MNKYIPLLNRLSCRIKIGTRFYHYKDKRTHYKVVGFGIQESTQKPAVIYTSSSGVVWIRDFVVWNSFVLHKGKKIKRFKRV